MTTAPPCQTCSFAFFLLICFCLVLSQAHDHYSALLLTRYLKLESAVSQGICGGAPGEDVRAGGDVREDVDYFDKTDLGGLRRRLRRAIEDKQREQELYLEIIARYLQVRCAELLCARASRCLSGLSLPVRLARRVLQGLTSPCVCYLMARYPCMHAHCSAAEGARLDECVRPRCLTFWRMRAAGGAPLCRPHTQSCLPSWHMRSGGGSACCEPGPSGAAPECHTDLLCRLLHGSDRDPCIFVLAVTKRSGCRAAAVLTGALSLAVTVAEVTLSDRLPNLSVFASALHATAGNETVSELLGFAFLVLPPAVGSRFVAMHLLLEELKLGLIDYMHCSNKASSSGLPVAGIPLLVHILCAF